MQRKMIAALAGLALALPCLAQDGSGGAAASIPKAYFPLVKGELYKPQSVDKFMAEVDKNHDGLLTKPEFSDAGLSTASYLSIEWPKDTLTKSQLEHHPFPAEALDENGELTVTGVKIYAEELRGFDQVFVAPKNVDKFMDEVDTNHDGKITEEEWQAAGLLPGIFGLINNVVGKGKGYITRQDMLNSRFEDYMMEPDGSLTLKSMKAYDEAHHPGQVADLHSQSGAGGPAGPSGSATTGSGQSQGGQRSAGGHTGPPESAPKPYFPLAKGNFYRPQGVEQFLTAVDTNHDGVISKQEWIGAGLAVDGFLSIEWPGDTITRTLLEHHPFPAESLDEKGELTLAGMKAYAAKLHGFE